jgi:antirestriction protein
MHVFCDGWTTCKEVFDEAQTNDIGVSLLPMIMVACTPNMFHDVVGGCSHFAARTACAAAMGRSSWTSPVDVEFKSRKGIGSFFRILL